MSKIVKLTRSVSSQAAAASKLVTPPFPLFGLEGRYTHALYSAATKQQKLDVVEKDLNNFQGILKTDAKLKDYLHNPAINKIEKKHILLKSLEKLKYSSITLNLFGAIAENGRLNILNSFISSFQRTMAAHRGEVACSITSAKALDAGQMSELRNVLQTFLKKGEVLLLETKVDPALMGGLVITIGDKYVDMSIASKIKTYTQILKQAV